MHPDDQTFHRLFNASVPILQAPMAGVATPALAAAVSEAGAIGGLGLGSSSVEKAQQSIRETQKLTSRPFNVNFFCHRPASCSDEKRRNWIDTLAEHFKAVGATPPTELNEPYPPFDENPDMLDMLVHTQPAVVSFHFGLPCKSAIEAIQGYGGTVLACATNLDEARAAEHAGVDAIVAQGIEAGGHRGNFNAERDDEIGLHTLLSLLDAHSRLPIIAAGGIMDARSMKAAMALGAVAVQLGTAFILCPESAASDAHRAALKSDTAYRTQVVRSISGRPARGIRGVFQERIEPLDPSTIPDYPVAYAAAKMLNTAAREAGDTRFSPNWAGQGAPLARELPACEIVRMLMNEGEA